MSVVTPLPPQVLVGHNRISAQALTSVTQAVASDFFGVPPTLVRVTLADDVGQLALTVSLPILVPSLKAVGENPDRSAALGGSVMERAIAGRTVIGERVMFLGGVIISRVDIRITGVVPAEGGNRV